LGFTESRRLQLAVEKSGVTGFIHRHNPKAESSSACTTRWKIRPTQSLSQDGLPGVTHAAWNVELLKVRNGLPGSWQIGWFGNRFTSMENRRASQDNEQLQVG
jgi:protein ImuA